MPVVCSEAPILTAHDAQRCGRALFKEGLKARAGLTLSRVEFARLLWAAYNRHVLQLCGQVPLESKIAAYNDWWASLAGRPVLDVWADLLTKLAWSEVGRNRDHALEVARQVRDAGAVIWQAG